MTAVIEAEVLGKRYHSRWALTDCTLSIPALALAWFCFWRLDRRLA